MKPNYPRLKNQLRIHWHWLRKWNNHKEVYKMLRAWLNTDEKIKKHESKISKGK